MANTRIVVTLITLIVAGQASADCEKKTELREIFPYYDKFLDALWVRVNSNIDDLKLSDVNVRVIKEDGTERYYPVSIPHWIMTRNGQPFEFPDDIQLAELEVKYSDECNIVVYRQQFQDELASLELKNLTIDWVGKDFVNLYTCFTQPEDNTIYVY